VPVLAVFGDRDLSNCTPPTCPQADAEASFYPKSPHFRSKSGRRSRTPSTSTVTPARPPT
jgi:hypothetical protein